MNIVKRTRLEEYKIKAALLIKNLHNQDVAIAEKAAERFLVLPFLTYSNVMAILNDRSFFQRKHALMIIAIEYGYINWNELRHNTIKEDCLFHNTSSSFLNVWFNNYEEAKQYQLNNSGYLLQYRKDYVICPVGYIASIGLDNMRAEWEATGYDWVKPSDVNAWNKIFQKAKANYVSNKISLPGKINKEKRPAWILNK